MMRQRLATATHKAKIESRWHAYSIFGITLASDFPFATRLLHGNGQPDLTFSCTLESVLPDHYLAVQPIYASSYRTSDGESIFCIYRNAGVDVLVFNTVAVFYIWPDRIVCQLLNPDYEKLIEIFLFGIVFSYWLELKGILTLHASAVAVNGRSIAFLASNEGGKSSIAATLIEHNFSMLTDDLLPIEQLHNMFICRSGYPQMRIWPDLAKHVLGSYDHLEQVHPVCSKLRIPIGFEGLGAFCERSQPLSCIYIPERHISENSLPAIEITSMPSTEAVIELIRHSFLPRVTESLDLQPQRLEMMAQMVMKVPVRKIRYHSGFDHLTCVREAILKDLESLPL